jgi:hypothetical protein
MLAIIYAHMHIHILNMQYTKDALHEGYLYQICIILRFGEFEGARDLLLQVLSRDSSHTGAMVRYGRILEDLAHEHQVFMHILVLIYACVFVYVCMYVCTDMQKYGFSGQHGNILKHLAHEYKVCMYIFALMCVCVCVRACVRTSVCIYAHTWIHLHTYISKWRPCVYEPSTATRT